MKKLPALLGHRLAPLTFEIGFLECDAARAASEFVSWRAPMFARDGITFRTRPVHGTIESVLRTLLPLASPERVRRVFVPTKGDWCAYFDNARQGGDPESVVGHMSYSRLHCRGVRVAYRPHSLRAAMEGRGRGDLLVTVFAPYPIGRSNTLRSVSLIRESSWEFLQIGKPFHWENTAVYQAVRPTDRFSAAALEEFASRLGIHMFDESFYDATASRPALLVEMKGVAWPSQREYTLEEVQAEHE